MYDILEDVDSIGSNLRFFIFTPELFFVVAVAVFVVLGALP